MDKDKMYDMSAGEVTIDLAALRRILGTACANAQAAQHKAEGQVSSANRAAASAFLNKDIEQEYHHNHTAQSYAQYIAQHAQEYAQALQAYFAITEALNGRELLVTRPE